MTKPTPRGMSATQIHDAKREVMKELTLEEQKILTEWLGDKWHYPTNDRMGCSCVCGDIFSRCPNRLDFSDWRVIGRLVTQYAKDEGAIVIAPVVDETWTALLEEHPRPYVCCDSPQLAICRAIISYLTKKGEK